MNSKGVQIANFDLILRIHRSLAHAKTHSGILFAFRRVTRDANQDADRLTNIALDYEKTYAFGKEGTF